MIKPLPLTLICTVLLFTSLSCKKLVEKKQEQLVMEAITNGTWMVEQFMEGANNVTYVFLDYNFQFYKNGTVTGTFDGATTTGTWSGDVSNYSITSQFAGAPDPLKKLNGVWKIKDSYWDFVKAEMNTSNGINIVRLRKKP